MNISYTPSRRVRVDAVDSPEQRRAVGQLVGSRYAWRGYDVPPPPDTVVCFRAFDEDDGTPVGTISVGLDGDEGLKAEATFPDDVEALRRSRRRLCEFTRLAIDPARGGEHVIAALFHAAYLYAHRQHDCDLVLLEVNPRHVRYYQRALDARVIGTERINARVNAPAVLLGIEFEDVSSRLHAGAAAVAGGGRSLFARALPPDEQQALLHRLQHLNFGAGMAAAAA